MLRQPGVMAHVRRWSYGDSSSTYSNEDVHRDLHRQRFGLVSFTDDDLAALSRRKLPTTFLTEHSPPAAAKPMAPLVEGQLGDDDSIISAIPTGLRAQQEALSALQKENFRLKLSLHTYRRKETMQTAQLESASSALRDFDCKKRALEKTLRHLRGEIIAGYRSLERLVSEQADVSIEKNTNESHMASDCREPSLQNNDGAVKEARYPVRTASLPRRSSRLGVSETTKEQNTRRHRRSSRDGSDGEIKIVTPGPAPIPTRRHFIEIQDDNKRASYAGNVKSSNDTSETTSEHMTWRNRLASVRNRGRLSIIIEPPDASETGNGSDSPDPWLSDKVLLNDGPSSSSRTAPLPRFLKQSRHRKTTSTNSDIDARQSTPYTATEKPAKLGLQQVNTSRKKRTFCGVRFSRRERHQSHTTTRKSKAVNKKQRNVRNWISNFSRKTSLSAESKGAKWQHRTREKPNPGFNKATVQV